jgi:hypothetical protein
VSKVVAIDEHMPMIEKANEKVDRLAKEERSGGRSVGGRVQAEKPGRASGGGAASTGQA